ncbi:MAG TPA: hypothetical protein DDY21_00225 [Candidatus Moranbacteria bacterium]|nr:hypothetical protein [Candidatus Moranbacteria bacterium]
MSKFSTYAPLIQSKLEALEESDNVALFVDVRYGHKKDFSGFPTAEFFKKASGGNVADTHKNLRQWEYTLILVYEFNGESTHEEVEELMDTCVDKVIQAFDTDDDLGGTCQRVEVAPVQFYDIILEEPFIFAEFTIVITDFVNRN